MLTCANCGNAAHFTYRITASEMIHYCSRCLPKFLNEARISGSLELYVPPKVTKKKTTTVTEEETPAEE